MRDGGILTFYALENVAEPGFMPHEALVDKGTAFYAYVTAGVVRRYEAIGANREFDVLVRCFSTLEAPDGAAYVVLEDGKQYRIDQATPIVDEDATELTLVRLEDFYDIAE